MTRRSYERVFVVVARDVLDMAYYFGTRWTCYIRSRLAQNDGGVMERSRRN